MKQSSKRLVSILISLLLVVAALIGFFDVIQPEYAVVENVKGEIAAEDSFLATESQTVTAVQKVIAEYQQQGGSQGQVALAIPAIPDVAGGLAQIYGMASESAVTIQSVSVSAPTIQTQVIHTASSSAAGAAGISPLKPMGMYSFQVAVSGSYESLKNFLTDIETNIRLFDVKNISLVPSGGSLNKSSGNPDLFTANFTVVTYYQTN